MAVVDRASSDVNRAGWVARSDSGATAGQAKDLKQDFVEQGHLEPRGSGWMNALYGQRPINRSGLLYPCFAS